MSAQGFVIVMFRKLKMESAGSTAIIRDSFNYYLAGAIVLIAERAEQLFPLQSHRFLAVASGDKRQHRPERVAGQV